MSAGQSHDAVRPDRSAGGSRRWVRRGMVGVAVSLVAAILLALLAAEVVMQPTTAQRLTLVAVFVGIGIVVASAALLLQRLTLRLTSLQTTVMLTAVGALAAAATATWGVAASMLISSEALKLVLIALGLGVALGLVLASAVTRPLEDDLAAIRTAADAVAGGRRDVRTGVTRADEVGRLATAFDDMVDDLSTAERERDRMEAARREFLASVGHDLRTPLTSLRAAIEALQDDLVDDPAVYLRAMETDVATLAGMVDDLFFLAVIESGGLRLHPAPTDVAELCDEALEALRPLADQQRVALALDGDGPRVAEIATGEFGRVLRNLLDNAIRHATSRVVVSLDGGDDEVRVTVVDDGPGFTADMVDRAFDSFVRADEARRRDGSGAGLGLPIARGLVAAMGGRIHATAGPGGRVVVSLPAGGG